ncbi:replication protein A 70 kDa DNA-binding subunit-like [Uloborus diversus]|uniref:replication protein A 70 kDa DNA-binding subunit-like n=1 Tax=Uloborus diversus TaxID=327109 RepID=UPI0024092CAA|nr:replication protein A 70 kDa DNA-binding subunit-like [Uloborus diversus]
MIPKLSFGALNCILDGLVMENVILQVLGYKFVPGSNNNRFRLLLNDGQMLFPYAILATQLNSLIENKQLEKYTIINLKKYVCSQISLEKKVIICLDIDVIALGTNVSQKISNASTSNSFNEADIPTQAFEVSTVTNTTPVVQQSLFNGDGLNSSTSSTHGRPVAQQSIFNNDQLNSSPLRTSEGPVVQRSIFNNEQLNSSTSSTHGRPIVRQSIFKNQFNFRPSRTSENTAVQQSICNNDQLNSCPSSSSGEPVVQRSIFNNDQLNSSTSSTHGGPVVQQSTFHNQFNSSSARTSGRPAVQQSIYNNERLNQSALSVSNCPSYKNSSSNADSSNSFVPISNLTPYQNKWVIRARVIYKTASISYRHQRHEGKYFSFYLLDDSGEIRVTAFNEHASLLEKTIELDKIYHISNAQVKLSKGNSAIKSDFELVVDQSTKIAAFDDDCATFPRLSFNFRQICDISSCSKDTVIDVIGICNAASDVKKIVARSDNKELSKRDVELIDTSETAVTISLWGVDAENFKQENHSVIAIRNAKVSDFRGHSISVSPFSMLFINPDIPETSELKRWFSNLNQNVMFQSISSNASLMMGNQNWKTFAQITANEQCYGDEAEYFSIKATIIMVAKEKCLYQACPAVDCFKKVQLIDGLFKCSKCNQIYSTFKWTCLLSINIADFTDSHWAIAFKEIAESFIGFTAKELYAMKESNEDKYYDVLSDLHFKSYIFNLRSKVETYNETSSLKTTILSKNNVDPLSYTKKLLGDIKRFSSILNDSE